MEEGEIPPVKMNVNDFIMKPFQVKEHFTR
jgi:hypothetical protein